MRELRAQQAIQTGEVVERFSGIGPRRVPSRVQGSCRLCGFSEIHTDEVVDRGVVFLAECPRCEHRWTSQEPIVTVGFARGFAKRVLEIIPAA